MATTETTTEEARAADWARALRLYDAWERASWAAQGGAGGGGYRDPHAGDEARRARGELDALLVRRGWHGTRVDPGLGWMARQSASWDMPEVTA